jgi:hypothetical protein
MQKKNFSILGFIPNLNDKEAYFEKITKDDIPLRDIITFIFLVGLLAFIYGTVMGSYHSFLQAAFAGIKLSFLFIMTLAICFPALFIVQLILGSKLKLSQMLSIILSGYFMTTVIMITFIPVVILFLLTGSNYYFLQLLHILVFIFSGLFGMKIIVDALKYSCEKKNVYPKIGVVIFTIWFTIFVLVGIQLAWNLRPFLGDRSKSFVAFRQYEGNFYTAVIFSVKRLLHPNF